MTTNIPLSHTLHDTRRFFFSRPLQVDIDVHHGNGTQAQWYNRSDLLFISLHQDRLYPLDTGDVTEIGEGEGRGYTLNVSLPPGCGWGAYEAAFAEVVMPALRAYRPEMVSCG
jgi:acetoin utilization deacetylase AcuC-like enzyme